MSPVAKAMWRIILRTTIVALLALAVWFLGPWIWHLLSPFLLAVPVAVALQRPIRWGEKRLRLKHGISVAVFVALVCVVICAALYWLVATVVAQVIQLSENYQTIISDIISLLRNVSNQIIDALDYVPQAAEEWIRGALNDAFAELSTTASRWLSAIFNYVVNFASGIPYALIYLNFLLLGIFFISANYRQLRGRVFSRMGDSLRSRSELLSVSAGQGMLGYVKVQSLYALLVLVVSIPCLTLFRLPYPFLIALLAAILEFLPIFGNGTLYIPWAIICYIIGLPTLGTEMLILHLMLFIFRRVTEPKLLSNHIGLSTLLSLVSMFAGMQLGGVLGLILAPIAMVLVQTAWQVGIFAGTVQDVRCLVAYLKATLAEAPPCETDDASKPSDKA